MGTLRSEFDWTGRDLYGTILGDPALDEITGHFIWDGEVPTGTIDAEGDVYAEVGA